MKLSCEYDDVDLAEDGMRLARVDLAGDDFIAVEEIYNGPNRPGTDAGRIHLGGAWRDKPDGYWAATGGLDGLVLLKGRGHRDALLLDPTGDVIRNTPLPPAGFPVALCGEVILFSVDQDDDGEEKSDYSLVSEGLFATDLNGEVVWRMATDADEGMREGVFSCEGSSLTPQGTALLTIYGGFPPDYDAWTLLEFDPSKREVTRLPFPEGANGTKAITDLGGGWLCALGGYKDRRGKHRIRAWRRDGSGDVLEATAPNLKGWIDWRANAGTGCFVTWHDRVVRRFRPSVT